ncbi:NYN domain-containing protein, partial [Patescibacteria group bacterium]|nr:NYN domain-containing protein [Patescibacteria group bacterium]
MSSSVKHKQQRVGVFVDVSNMYHSSRNLYKAKVNFESVLKVGVAGRKLIRAFAYVIEADVKGEKGFFEALEKQGFEVRAKEIQVFAGGAKKGDWDVGLCMDVVRLTPLLDTVVLVSGDGDYVDLLNYLRGHGRRTEVIAFGRTTSHRLIDEADE